MASIFDIIETLESAQEELRSALWDEDVHSKISQILDETTSYTSYSSVRLARVSLSRLLKKAQGQLRKQKADERAELNKLKREFQGGEPAPEELGVAIRRLVLEIDCDFTRADDFNQFTRMVEERRYADDAYASCSRYPRDVESYLAYRARPYSRDANWYLKCERYRTERLSAFAYDAADDISLRCRMDDVVISVLEDLAVAVADHLESLALERVPLLEDAMRQLDDELARFGVEICGHHVLRRFTGWEWTWRKDSRGWCLP